MSKKLTLVVVTCFGLLGLAVVLQLTPRTQKAAGLQSQAMSTAPAENDEKQLSSLSQGDVPASARYEVEPVVEDTLVEADAGQLEALEPAAGDLDAHARMSLDGAIYINDVLDRMLEFAELPVSDHPDLDYEDDDAIAYELVGAPDGTDARVLVGIQPYEEDGKAFRYMQLSVTPETSDPDELIEGVIREPPNLHLSISYDVDDPLKPTRFSLIAQRAVDIARSRDAGIDAYHGRFTNGARYWVDLLKDPNNPTTGTIGLVDAQFQSAQRFQGVMPLLGDTELDHERLAALLQQLHVHLATIKGK